MPRKKASRSIWKRIGRGFLLLAFLIAAYAGYIYVTLPDVTPLVKENPKTTAFMQLRIAEARDAGRKFSIRQQWLPYRQISPLLRRAVIVTEDAAFFDHDGIDLDEIRASLERNWEEGQFSRAAPARSRSNWRRTAPVARRETRCAKVTELLTARPVRSWRSPSSASSDLSQHDRMGRRIFGCEAAARAYFGKACANLDTRGGGVDGGAIINPRFG